jgi:hypothetical protein
MVRAAVLAIVVSFSGPPAVGVVCGFLCGQDVGATARHSGCQDERSDSTGARITGMHACDHLTAVHPFVMQASQSVPAVQIATVNLPAVLGSSSEHSPLLGDRPDPPGGGGVVLHSRSPILRI